MTGEDLGEIDYGSLVEAYYGCLRELAGQGLSLISDNAVTTRANAERLACAASGHDVVLVGIECSVETAEARETVRGDRRRGLARMQMPAIHQWLAYDLRVDTDSSSPEENAARILEVVESGRRGAFEEMVARLGLKVLPRS